MPTYSVQLKVNVPGLGDRVITQPSINAVDVEAAIKQAKAGITIEFQQATLLPTPPGP